MRCTVDTTYSLPSADGAHWLGAIYRRVYIGPSDSISMAIRHSTRDTAVLITAALYSAPSAGNSCVNGTGGCSQSYMRGRGGKWTAVVETFWRQIPPIKDGRIGKGMGVDVGSLTGSYGVYGEADGNCCPSREILLELEQRGDSLVLKKYRVRAAPR